MPQVTVATSYDVTVDGMEVATDSSDGLRRSPTSSGHESAATPL